MILLYTHSTIPTNLYAAAWAELWKLTWLSKPAWIRSVNSSESQECRIKEVAKRAGVKESTMRRFVSEANSEEARALYELELITGI